MGRMKTGDTGERVVRVNAASRGYDVVVGRGVLGQVGARVAGTVGRVRAAHVFVDSGLIGAGETGGAGGEGALRTVLGSLKSVGTAVEHSTITPTEEGKSLQTAHAMLQDLTRRRLERGDVVVALGGGIVSDMAGFVAATYRRGVAWVNCPTTLLAMVDASVGGKTGVNVRVGNELKKNMVGAFWQPWAVLADVSVLGTLSERIYRCGLAECIKHGMISADWGDADLLRWTRGQMAAIGARDEGVLTELVARNVAVKAAVVGSDERETAEDAAGGRALLNLGHTFGHALEGMREISPTAPAAGTATTLPRSDAPLEHGEAVALGLVCAARCAELMKLVGPGVCDEVRGTLRHAGLPVTAYGLPTGAAVLEAMGHDKKSSGGVMRLVLPCGEGRARVVSGAGREVVLEAIESVRG